MTSELTPDQWRKFYEALDSNKKEEQMEQNFSNEVAQERLEDKVFDQTVAETMAPSIIPTDDLMIEQGDIVEYFQDTEALAEA